MSYIKRAGYILLITIIIFQLYGCGQQRPAGGNQQKTDTTQQRQGTTPSDTTRDTAR